MKRSFRLHIFIRVMLITFVIIYANRLIAQNFLHGQMTDRVQQEMGSALLQCEADIGQMDRFLACQRKIQPGSFTNSFFELVEHCTTDTLREGKNPSGLCARALQASDFWSEAKSVKSGKIQLASHHENGVRWWGVRRGEASSGAVLLVNEQSIDGLIQQLWSLRDRNLVFVLPVVLTMLIFLTLYLMNVFMRPIEQLEKTLSRMTSNNLGQASQLNAPYKEFDKLVRVFEDLRVRLHDSFAKARRFAADAAHELRTPLTIMRGNAEQMNHELPVGSKSHVRVNMISEEVERLIDITEKLLLLSRADGQSMVLVPKPFDISDFLTLLIEDGDPYPHNLTVTSTLQANVVWSCDAGLARQLIHNLFANAIKYNIPSGWIHLDLRCHEERMTLAISNSSGEIPADLSQRAFDRFYRGNSAHSRKIDGQGLGLSLAMEIAKLHGGQLSMATTHDTVSVTLDVPLKFTPMTS